MDSSAKQITFDKEDWINECSLHLPFINTVTSEQQQEPSMLRELSSC